VDDYPAKIADFVESIAVRIRELTVDRIATAITWAALGVIIALMSLVAVAFALIGLLRILGEFVGTEWAYVILGGLFLVIAAFLWRMRQPESPEPSKMAEAAKTAETATPPERALRPESPEPSKMGEAAKTAETAAPPESALGPEAPKPPEAGENQ
jgi:hypothetical protein